MLRFQKKTKKSSETVVNTGSENLYLTTGKKRYRTNSSLQTDRLLEVEDSA